MDGSSVQIGQDPNCIARLMPAFGMHDIASQLIRTGRVEPVQLAIDMGSGFIEVHDLFFFSQVLFDRLVDRRHLFRHTLTSFQDRAFCQGMPPYIRKGFADTLQRDHLILVQVHR